MSCGDTPRLEPQFYLCQELAHGGQDAFFYHPFSWSMESPPFGRFERAGAFNLNDWLVGFKCNEHSSGGSTSYERGTDGERIWITTRRGTIYVDHLSRVERRQIIGATEVQASWPLLVCRNRKNFCASVWASSSRALARHLCAAHYGASPARL